jgi:hypothetical protein
MQNVPHPCRIRGASLRMLYMGCLWMQGLYLAIGSEPPPRPREAAAKVD